MSAEAIENVEQLYPVTVVIARRHPVLTITSPGRAGGGGLVLLDSLSRPSQATHVKEHSMKVRKVVTMSAIAIALASGPAIGVAQADPPSPPSPTPAPPYLMPPWITGEDARSQLGDVIQQAVQEALRDPEHTNESISQLIIEGLLP